MMLVVGSSIDTHTHVGCRLGKLALLGGRLFAGDGVRKNFSLSFIFCYFRPVNFQRRGETKWKVRCCDGKVVLFLC